VADRAVDLDQSRSTAVDVASPRMGRSATRIDSDIDHELLELAEETDQVATAINDPDVRVALIVLAERYEALVAKRSAEQTVDQSAGES
jgi:hypothetical protein